MDSQLSGERPSAIERRKAISGLIPLVPFKTRLSVDAATPEVGGEFTTTQAMRLEVHLGDKRARMGGIVHLHSSTSVVILIVDQLGVLAGETKRDPPITAHLNGPRSLASALKLVQLETRQSKVPR